MMHSFDDPWLADAITHGAVGVIPTDTLYGLVASALLSAAVAKVYDLKGRDADKPCIILLDKAETALQFGIPQDELRIAETWWPAPLSIVFSGIAPEFEYLLRGKDSLPFRVPRDPELRAFLARSGPLIAPSANRQGEPPAETIDAAQRVFGDAVDFYVDGGPRQGAPSTIVRIQGEHWEVLRPGAFEVPSSH